MEFTIANALAVIDKYKAESAKKMGMTNGEKIQRVYCCEVCEPTIKNDSAIDCIVDILGSYTDLDIPYKREIAENILANLPSVTTQEPRWIPVSERLPEEHICDDGYHEPSKSVLVQMKSGAMHTARYWSRYDEKWLDLNYPTTDEVIAWMPLPKPYEPQESEET